MPKAEYDTKANKHFAVGLIVTVHDKAVPVGCTRDEYMEFNSNPDRPVRQAVTAVAGSEVLAPYGSFEVGRWWWDPRDLYVGLGDN